MAVSVKKLEGIAVPEAFRNGSTPRIFEVIDVDGNAHYRESEVDAAKLAVALSEAAKKKDSGACKE